MQIEWFEVRGYKNFRARARLPALGRFNVIHGDNNVGKSNLLESIGLLFESVHALREEARGGPTLEERYARRESLGESEDGARLPRATVRTGEYFSARGYSPSEIFNLSDGRPIELEAQLQLDQLAHDPSWLGAPIVIRVELQREDESIAVRIERLLRMADGADLANGAGGTGDDRAIDAAFGLVLERLGPRSRGKANAPLFALIRADRTLAREAGDASPLTTREPLPRELGRALHDAEGATDARRARFRKFIASLERFRDLVGPGTWRMRFDPVAERAELVLDTGAELLPLRLMGSGVQQVAILCARLLMTGADIVAIEEPELNLRWSVQRALRDVLHEIAGGPDGPAQIILASHSGQFEEEPTFYLLTRTSEGPRIDQKPAEEAWVYTQPTSRPLPSGTRAPLGYLTSEGLVEVPAAVRENLGLSHGGGVVFVQGRDGHYRMLTNDQYADLFESREPQS